jgi:hypothetical protein
MSAMDSIVGRMMSQSSASFVKNVFQRECADIPQLNLRFNFRRV